MLLSMTINTYAFEGKTVLVTGAGSGIGRAIARAFLENGANVVALGRRPDALAETLDGTPDGAGRGLAIPTDVADPAQIRAAVEQAVERFGALDVVVSNAGTFVGGPLAELDPQAWETMRSTNIDAFFHLAQAVLPRLEESGGNLVAISSVSGFRGDAGQAAYNASKHAVSGFVSSLALDHGPRGVRVNAVAPSFTLTDATTPWITGEADLAPFLARIPLGRPGLPEYIAPAVLWLASGDASYVTGTTLVVDGGTSASTGQPLPAA